MKLELTQKQVELLKMALSVAIENDETFYVEGCKRDAQAAADYRGMNQLLDKLRN